MGLVSSEFLFLCFFFFKQKTTYEIKECDWSPDVCSSDLTKAGQPQPQQQNQASKPVALHQQDAFAVGGPRRARVGCLNWISCGHFAHRAGRPSASALKELEVRDRQTFHPKPCILVICIEA